MARSMLHRRTFERAATLPVLLLPLPGEGWDGGTHDADSIPPLASAFFAGYPSGKNAGATIYYKKRSCSRSIYMGYSSKILDIQRKPTQDNRHSREGGNPEDQEPIRVAVCFPSGNIWRERFSRQARQLRRPARPILFDMDGDGTKHATGWVAAGEAIVVRDINGNGLIDSGRELFGDATLLTRGLRAGQNAANGFEALADLDLDANGVSDGKFDANDVAYSSVKLWQDTNQDGISQANELHSFTDLGVASINVSGTASSINLGGGNTQAFTGSFTRTNGQSGNAGTAELAGSLLLAANNFYREFSDNPPVTTTAKALPQMQGRGTVRDLREAMSLGNLAAQSLQTQVAQFAAGKVTIKNVVLRTFKSRGIGRLDVRKRVSCATNRSKSYSLPR